MIPAEPRVRAVFARLVVVLAALVGIALVQGGQCQAAMPMDMGAMSMDMGAAGSAVTADHAALSSVAAPGDRGPDRIGIDAAVSTVVNADTADRSVPAPAGVVMACLAVFLALLSGLALPRRTVGPLLVRLIATDRVFRLRSAPSRAPSLAELCVLRT